MKLISPYTNKKIYKSASLTFYNSNYGYLICEEYRYKEKKTLLHPIGGKNENYDKNIFETAIREFIEETNILNHTVLNKKNLSKNEMIKIIMDNIIDNTYYVDVCVNINFRYYHRFYLSIIPNDLATDEFYKQIISLPIFFNGNHKTEINNVIWKHKSDNVNKCSWLTKKLFIFTTNKKY